MVGFSTKIPLKTDKDGQALAFEITGGAANDAPLMPTLIANGPDTQPRAMIADKGSDSAGNRAAARAEGAVPVIPYRRHC